MQSSRNNSVKHDELPIEQKEWVGFLLQSGFIPQSMLTLTFDLKKHAISVDQAAWWWRRLVDRLNADMGGPNYRDKWGHSYFGYAMGSEYTKVGVVHLHAVVDNWVNFRTVHRWWNLYNGFAWIRKTDDLVSSLGYVLKYVVKSDLAPSIWLQKKRQVVDHLRIEQVERPSGVRAPPAPLLSRLASFATRRAAPSTASALTKRKAGRRSGRPFHRG